MARKKASASLDNTLPDIQEVRELDPDIYNGIAKCAELLSVQLIESNFNLLPSFFDDDEGKFGIDVMELHSSFDDESRVTTCIFQYENFKKKGHKKTFSIKDKFVVFYRIPTECDEFHATSFARRVGVMACYPYFRAHVAQTASLANAEMPILPTVSKMPVRQRELKKEKAK